MPFCFHIFNTFPQRPEPIAEWPSDDHFSIYLSDLQTLNPKTVDRIRGLLLKSQSRLHFVAGKLFYDINKPIRFKIKG